MDTSIGRSCRGRAIRAAAAVMIALLTGCAPPGQQARSDGRPPPGECPQPRFTGSAPEPIRSRENPLPDTVAQRTAGRRLYLKAAEPECAMCHGRRGDGRGPLAGQFDPRPRNFACARTVEGLPDGQLFWIISNGSPGTAMPGYGDQLTERQTWQLVHHLRWLAR